MFPRVVHAVCGLHPGRGARPYRDIAMTLTTLLVILLVLVLIGALPIYPYSRDWGYYPSGLLAVIVAIVALMLLL